MRDLGVESVVVVLWKGSRAEVGQATRRDFSSDAFSRKVPATNRASNRDGNMPAIIAPDWAAYYHVVALEDFIVLVCFFMYAREASSFRFWMRAWAEPTRLD